MSSQIRVGLEAFQIRLSGLKLHLWYEKRNAKGVGHWEIRKIWERDEAQLKTLRRSIFWIVREAFGQCHSDALYRDLFFDNDQGSSESFEQDHRAKS
jgi:hypothetical protein